MSASSSKLSISNLTPDQLRTLVLDYLYHGCYTRTAAAFSRDSNPVKQLDADGDEILPGSRVNGISGPPVTDGSDKLLEEIKLRQEIRVQILSGHVDDAINSLNKYFPTVLAQTPPPGEGGRTTTTAGCATPTGARIDTAKCNPFTNNLEYLSSTSTNPTHLLLNLRILAFCEACRTVPLNYPPDPPSASIPIQNGIDDVDVDIEDSDSQMALLIKAQKLFAYTNMLPNVAERAIYLKELENVGGLLAYKVPEKSSMSKYLSMERREAVADQINKAILKRTGRRLVSTLELISRYTTVLWGSAHELGVKPRPGAVLPPKPMDNSDMDVDHDCVPLFSLPRFIGSKP